jgi:hypothetical protein
MQRGKSTHFILAILIVVSFLFTAAVWAQSFRGSIRGQVTDPSGSIIAGAKVTAKNIGTGLLRQTTTSADGSYVLAELPAGEYTVTAESAGLSPAAQNVMVNVGLSVAGADRQ